MLQSFHDARLVMCYMDFRNEVMTSDIILNCLELGKKVAIPCSVVTPSGENMLTVYEIKDITCDVCDGMYGIREPDRRKVPQVDPKEIDIVLVPGVAYDLNRFRIGYGAGYYDRFLRTVRPGCFMAGLAFDLQIVDHIPSEGHDMQMDAIITESRIIF
jgi:5-formyltetrahydrofolate cyclo-ligase